MSRGTVHDEGVTRIGSNCLFMAYTHVAHDCIIGDNVIMVNLAMIAGHVHIGDWAILSGYAAVHQHCKIGAHAFIANNTGVTRDVPPYVMAVGNPATPHSINTEGLKRRGFSAEQIRNLRNAYRMLYRSDLPLAPPWSSSRRWRRAARAAAAAGFHRQIGTQSDPLMQAGAPTASCA